MTKHNLDDILKEKGFPKDLPFDKKFHAGIEYLREYIGSNPEVNAVLDGISELQDIDLLTGLGRRLSLEKKFYDAHSRFERNGVPFAVILADVDNFKGINDTYGHGVGDTILKKVVERMDSGIRNIDGLYRYGGDEFAGVISGVNKESALVAADHMVKRVSASNINVKEDVNLVPVISAGVYLVGKNDKYEHAMDKADVALYRAKDGGKNRASL